MSAQVDEARTPAAEDFLGPQAEAEWQRLRRQVDLSPGFWLGFVFPRSPRAARIFVSRLAAVYRGHARCLHTLEAASPEDMLHLLDQLFSAESRAADAVWVSAAQDLATERQPAWTAAWHQFLLRLNEHRERVRRELHGGLVLEVPPEIKPDVRNAAPDLWSIRSLVLEPVGPAVQQHALRAARLSAAERSDVSAELSAAIPRGRTLQHGAGGSLEQAVLGAFRETEGLLLIDQTGRAVERARQAIGLLIGEQQHPMLADALALLARAELADGDHAAALDHFRQALQRAEGSDDRSLLSWWDAAATAARAVGELDLAHSFILRQEVLARQRLQRYGESPQSLRDLSICLDNVGDMRWETGELPGAQAAYAESLEISRWLLQKYGESLESLRDVSVTLDKVGDVHRETGNLLAAERAYAESLEVRRRLLQLYGESPQTLRDVSFGLNRVGSVRYQRGELLAAEAAYAESLEHRRRLLQLYGETPRALRDVSISLDNVGDVRQETGDVSAAASAYAESLETRLQLMQKCGDNPQTLRDLSVSLDRIGDVRWAAGDLPGAEAAYAKSLEISRRLLQRHGESAQTLRDVSVSLNNLGDVHRKTRALPAAEEAYAESLEICRRVLQLYGETPERLKDLLWILLRVQQTRRLLRGDLADSDLDAEISSVTERLRVLSSDRVAESPDCGRSALPSE